MLPQLMDEFVDHEKNVKAAVNKLNQTGFFDSIIEHVNKKPTGGATINGNAKENWLDFMAPVRIEEPVDKLLINAGKTRYWIEEKKITSSAPVDGTFKELKATGSQLEILQADKQVTIGKDCKLTQPGEFLEAKRCRWNWGSGAVQAIGNVVLKRDELKPKICMLRMPNCGLSRCRSPAMQV